MCAVAITCLNPLFAHTLFNLLIMKPRDKIYLKKDVPDEVYQRYGISKKLLLKHLGEMIEINSISDGLITILVDGYYIQLSPEMYIVPKFQVGDVVTIAKRKGTSEDYPYTFIYDMIKSEGFSYKIKEVLYYEHDSDCKYYEEPFVYRLHSVCYTWSSAMFVQKEKQKLIPTATLGGIDTEGHAVKDYAIPTFKIKSKKINLKFE